MAPCFKAFNEWPLGPVCEVRQNFVEAGMCGGAELLSKEEGQEEARVEVYPS